MEYEKLYIYYKNQNGSDKNNNLQILSKDKNKLDYFRSIIFKYQYHPEYIKLYNSEFYPFVSLHLFLQGDSDEWKMIESWSYNDSLFLDFCMFVSEKLNMPLEFGK